MDIGGFCSANFETSVDKQWEMIYFVFRYVSIVILIGLSLKNAGSNALPPLTGVISGKYF